MEAYIRKKQYNAKTIIQDIELDIEDGGIALYANRKRIYISAWY